MLIQIVKTVAKYVFILLGIATILGSASLFLWTTTTFFKWLEGIGFIGLLLSRFVQDGTVSGYHKLEQQYKANENSHSLTSSTYDTEDSIGDNYRLGIFIGCILSFICIVVFVGYCFADLFSSINTGVTIETSNESISLPSPLLYFASILLITILSLIIEEKYKIDSRITIGVVLLIIFYIIFG